MELPGTFHPDAAAEPYRANPACSRVQGLFGALR
jgi:hypothetical protein